MSHRQARGLLALAPVMLSIAACDDFRAPARRPPPSPPASLAKTGAPTSQRPAPALTAVSETVSAAAQRIAVTASPAPSDASEPAAPSPLIEAEVLLDRAHFSPGEIDGKAGTNLRNAAKAYQVSGGLPPTGEADASLVAALRQSDSQPVLQYYAITVDDEKGPFLGSVPMRFPALAKLKGIGYATPGEALAEKFHMSPTLLKKLNPNADVTVVGTRLVVVRTGAPDLGAKVAKVEVDKSANQLRAMDGAGKLVGVFPATVGSTERPAPMGQWAVTSVVSDPVYTYDPKRLTFGNRAKGVLRIAPGPNNPVGSTWIGLTKATYGIHGSPDPAKVGKTASHGCVRLTNWDAAILGRALGKGTPVIFVGSTRRS